MKIGFNCSSFDLFHAGHVTMLKMERELCDYLKVALQVDPTIDRPGIKNKPSQKKFYEGWISRINDLYEKNKEYAKGVGIGILGLVAITALVIYGVKQIKRAA